MVADFFEDIKKVIDPKKTQDNKPSIVKNMKRRFEIINTLQTTTDPNRFKPQAVFDGKNLFAFHNVLGGGQNSTMVCLSLSRDDRELIVCHPHLVLC